MNSSIIEKRPRTLYDVSAKGYKARIGILDDNLAKAKQGDEPCRKQIIFQFKSRANVPSDVFIEWAQLKFDNTGYPVPTKPATKSFSKKKIVETYGCTCEKSSCGSCDQGWHKSCSQCDFGRPIPVS